MSKIVDNQWGYDWDEDKNNENEDKNNDTIHITLYDFYNHTLKYQNVLIAIKEFNYHFKHNVYDRYGKYDDYKYYDDRDYYNEIEDYDEEYQNMCEDKYMNNKDSYNDSYNDQYEDKLYGHTNDWETYWDSIYN